MAEQDLENSINLNLAECSKKYTPVSIDIVLVYDTPVSADWDFFICIIEIYQEVMREYLEINTDEDMISVDHNSNHSIITDELLCCHLEPEDENLSIIHKHMIHFPYCKVEKSLHSFLRQKVIERLRKMNAFSKLSSQPLNDWEEILILNKESYLYRSCAPNSKKTSLENIITRTGECVSLENVFDPKYHSHFRKFMNSDSKIFETKNLEHWLPMFMSLNYWVGVVSPKININNSSNSISVEIMSNEDLQIIQELCHLLDSSRFDDLGFLLNLGRSIHNVCEGDEEGLELYQMLTKQSNIFEEDDCENYYFEFDEENCENNPYKYITLNTIKFYAREDSPNEYKLWLEKHTEKLMKKVIKGGQCDLAMLMYEYYCLDYVCSNPSKNEWYYFNKKRHRWIPMNGATRLLKEMSSSFRDIFIDRAKQESNEFYESLRDNVDKKVKPKNSKKLQEIIMMLSNNSSKRSLLSECCTYFDCDFFKKILDTNINIMGVLNGVIETQEEKAIFRPGKPEDYISKYSTIRYKEFSWEDEKVKKVMTWIRQIFYHDDLIEYNLKLWSACLKSARFLKILPVLTGGGDNSKSMFKILIETCFGCYSVTIPKEVFTKKKTSSSTATPEMARCKGAKIVWFQETNSDDKLQEGDIKMFTGGDKVFVRFLHDNGFEMKPTFLLVLCCNGPPEMEAQKAVENRVVCIPYDSTWVDNPPKSEEEQWEQRLFKKDNNFELSISKMAPAFLWILVQKYETFVSEGLNIPNSIKNKTKQYWEDTDSYKQFINDVLEPVYCIDQDEKCLDSNKRILIKNVYTEFKTWYISNFGDKPPKFSTFCTNFCRKIKNTDGGLSIDKNSEFGIDKKSKFVKGYKISNNIEELY